MKLLTLVLIPLSLYGSAQYKYTPEQMKALKPPLHPQLYDGKPKLKSPSSLKSPHIGPHTASLAQAMLIPPLHLHGVLAAIPEGIVKPKPVRKRVCFKNKVPNNTPELSAAATHMMPPFPEIVITCEPIKVDK